MRAQTQICSAVLSVLSVALSAAPAKAQQPKPGDAAPAISLETWLNTKADAKPPTLETLKGRVIMIEFWGTWCGPCVRAMPEVQKMHDRYRERGLTVLAISYEAPEAMKSFLEKNAYTMTVGSDPEKKVVSAYGVRGWPSTFVIDKEGKIAYAGGPYGVEAPIEKALGLEASPASLLTIYLDKQKETDKEQRREALARLVEKATPSFDLQAWARAYGNPEQTTPGAEPASRPQPVEASAAKAPVVNGAELLRKVAAAWNAKDLAQRQNLLRTLGADGPSEFDLASWAKEVYGKAFPLEAKELQALLQQQKHAAALDAIVTRSPAVPVLMVAAKDQKLADFCQKKVEETRKLAKQAIMAQGWLFSGVQPKDDKAFFGELAMSGAAMSKDQKELIGVILGGATLMKADAESFIQNHLAQALIMEALAKGQAPKLSELPQLVTKERQKITKPLEDRYGALPAKGAAPKTGK